MIRAILVAADEADCDGARAVRAALNVAALSRQEVADLINEAGVTDIPVNEGPTYIASWWASLSPDAQALLLRDHPEIIGNLDGVPFDVRVAANRVNITNALADVQQSIPDLEQRLSEAQARWDENLASGTPDGTLGAELSTEISQLEQELDDARRHAEMYDRLLNEDTVRYENGARTTGRGHQVVLFDPENGAFAEIVGNLDAATQNIAVMVPGTGSNFLNMTGPDSAYDRCESFVTADDVKPDGSLAVVSWIGGPLPQDLITEAPQARFAGDLAPRLASFTDGLTNPGDVPVTVVGHSYGGSGRRPGGSSRDARGPGPARGVSGRRARGRRHRRVRLPGHRPVLHDRPRRLDRILPGRGVSRLGSRRGPRRAVWGRATRDRTGAGRRSQ